MAMLEKWEREGISKILGDDKNVIIRDEKAQAIDLNGPRATPIQQKGGSNYDDFFNL